MKKAMRFFTSSGFLLPLSALICALPYSVPLLFFLSWFSFVPFFILLLRDGKTLSLPRAFGRGILFGFFYHLGIYFWFLWLYPFEFIGFSVPTAIGVTLLAWCGISLIHGLVFSFIPFLYAIFFRRISENKTLGAFFIIFLFLLCEKSLEWTSLAFPWIRICLGQFRFPAFLQAASLFGTLGVDLMILSVNALIALAVLCREKKKLFTALSALVFFINFGFGQIRLLIGTDTERSFSASLVQGCVLSGEKWENEAASSFERYVSMTQEIADRNDKPDLVLWPESAVPIMLKEGEISEYQALSQKLGAPILMGTFTENEAYQTQNSAVLIDENSVSLPYSKRHLVPFGEYMPYREVLSVLIPPLSEINMLSSDLAPGESSAVMETSGGKIGCAVCFDSIFPSLLRESKKDGAELFVIVTNDSWYEDSPAIYQHLAHAALRSIENGVCTVRCANSGVSAFIDSFGKVSAELGPLKCGILDGEAYYSSQKTLYTAIGDALLPALGTLLLALCIIEKNRKENQKGGGDGRKAK